MAGGSSVRAGAYVARSVVLVPPMYVNTGAYVDEGTMVDSHALVGSCAQIGKRGTSERRGSDRRGAGADQCQPGGHRG